MKCANCGHDPNVGQCHNCGREIYYDHDSGFWIHAGWGKVDGRNGLFCSPGMWDGTEAKVYAHPSDPAAEPDAHLRDALKRIQDSAESMARLDPCSFGWPVIADIAANALGA